jgi:hypothetical protein
MARHLCGLCLVVALLGACSSDSEDSTSKNVCEKACDKLESCPGQQCTGNFDNCDSATQKIAECVLATPCDQLASCI